jgi:hypothetical protein
MTHRGAHLQVDALDELVLLGQAGDVGEGEIGAMQV